MLPHRISSDLRYRSSGNKIMMKENGLKEDSQHVQCAHCEARVRLEEAVSYEHRLLYGEHYHCRQCDPDGVWDCMSHDTDLEVH